MRHISTCVAQGLVDKGFVTSVHIEETLLGDFFCKFCVYVKATRKPILKACTVEQGEAFGDKIHSDIWGPAPVQKKGKKHYYITGLVFDAAWLMYQGSLFGLWRGVFQ